MEPDADEIVEKALADEAIDFSREAFAYVKKSSNVYDILYSLSRLCQVFLKGNELTEETEGLLHQLVTKCISENNLDGEVINDSFIILHTFYSKIHESFPMGEESILVQKNIELCCMKLLELESCHDGSVSYVIISQKIKPYFKGNADLHI